jgi:hypothetical protein
MTRASEPDHKRFSSGPAGRFTGSERREGGTRPGTGSGTRAGAGRRTTVREGATPRPITFGLIGGLSSATLSVDEENLIRSFGVGGMVGGELAFGSVGPTFAIGVRYTHGLSNISDVSGTTLRNRALGVYGSLEFARRGSERVRSGYRP